MLICSVHLRRSNRTRTDCKLIYRWIRLLEHVEGTTTTPWQRIITFGIDSDSLVSMNITKWLLVENLASQFELHRKYQTTMELFDKIQIGAKSLLFGQLIALDLFSGTLKPANHSTNCASYLGIIPSSIYVCLDYALHVLLKIVTNSNLLDCKIRWTTFQEMETSSSPLQTNRRHSELLRGVFAITNGGRINCASYTDTALQNAW